ncbi:MAG: hypothetical protein HRT44_10700 [Bdellovibrionales bacterium]|nr:permease-like cell division protein FtsX [Bdellovibrionales bacterium]NQZ19710.1 hypothetical protein [Bdellovibrionales bacterium]
MWAIFQTIKGSWLKHLVTQLSALFILTATYSVALFIILSTNNLKNIFGVWGKVSEATIYLKNDVSVDQKNSLNQYLESHPLVMSSSFESSEKAAEDFNKRFQEMSSQSMAAGNIKSFFPSTYKVKFNEDHIYEKNKSKLDGFTATLKTKHPFVEDVSYGKIWLSRYEKVIAGIESLSWLVVLIILAASMFVSSNVIKTILFAKKSEIEILEFVGASQSWIMGPHIINISMINTASFILSIFLTLSVYTVTQGQMALILSESILSELSYISPVSLFGYFCLITTGVSLYSFMSISSLLPKNRLKTGYVTGED